jgi:hypothetical protein
VGREQVREVAEFKYLGGLATADEVSAEIGARIASGNRCFHAFIRLLKASTLPRKLKLTV